MDMWGICRSLAPSVGSRNKALYSALPEPGVIRLVKIFPGNWDDINVNFRHYPILHLL